ncbi:MAG: iron-sulfur cluster assembly scaffold protein [Candidatus Nomurabacteria bacterium]|jgi:nitrogen fixation NifU-like protein|nr:iron-sulfur cluster assembly scaffold protein [Candidatus Nomurabacteria bacterium]
MDKLLLEEVIARYKHPKHRGDTKSKCCKKCSAKNLSCGDDVVLYIGIQSGKIANASFNGSLCSIANYGADLLCESVIGKTVGEAKSITSQELLKTNTGLLGNPVRLKCFELAQDALKLL